ncbi:Anti-sigma-K factor RskA [Rhodococcus sp. RD6.2]|uniref:anti-sigma factor n=1 Tax=Rhodococcus sp. RD6.2 TaxID=260936 RepID=UPI00063B2139|nr:anti-sigma factor [Rhodococcus sp. RD6.2]CRK51155.1 Anti-sigma-K factor RskA [Rhodococcus sp. RD6.2]
MTEHTLLGGTGDDSLDLAEVYALDAISDHERARIDTALAAAPPAEAAEFTRRVREARETMAEVSEATATEPPVRLRATILAAVAADRPAAEPVDLATRRPRRMRTALLAAAAAVVVAVGGGVAATRMIGDEMAPTAEQVLAADDVRTSSGAIEGGGTATVVYSKDADAGVLVMNNVTPPAPGTVYQMWLVQGPDMVPAGTMDAATVAPSTTAVLDGIGDATALAFTVEPPGGSTQPTSEPFAQLPLT